MHIEGFKVTVTVIVGGHCQYPFSFVKDNSMDCVLGIQNATVCYDRAMPFLVGVGGNLASALSVRPVCTFVRPLCTKNGFCGISIEYIGILDSYFKHASI